jgi:predicted PolB exonuclease-like 3'-5' exonuclease
MLCVFDCETIPDLEMVKKFYTTYSEDEYMICQEAFDAQEEKTGSSFLPLPFHKVVTISAVIADDFGNFIKVGTFANGKEEKYIIEEFFKFIDSKNPKIVSFNGRAFDMPMLLIRAMKYNISLPAYFEVNNQALNKSKWENYRTRFSENFHNDLLETIGNYGAVRGLKLDEICYMSGLPGKFDVHGDEVTKLYFDGEADKIEEYCESDVLNTYWLYLKYELLKGTLSLNEYKDILSGFFDKIPENKSYSKVFREYIQKELKVN